MTRLSLDTETLGTSAGSVILQIACTNVDNPTKKFNCYIEPFHQLPLGLTVEAATADWWNNQPQKVRDKVFSGNALLSEALTGLATFILCERDSYSMEVWMNSPSFDSEKILQPAFKLLELPLPWQFYEERDFRTMKALGKDYFNFPFSKPTGAHDALVDAKAQGEYIYQLTNRMKEK